MSERGVFAVDRGIWDHPLLKEEGREFSRLQAWVWLVSEAAWKPHQIKRAGKLINVVRGQLVHSLRFMAAQWHWAEAKVRRFLAEFIDQGMLDAQTDAGITVLTVIKYDEYQRVSLPDRAMSDAPFDAQVTHDRRKGEYKEDTLSVVPLSKDLLGVSEGTLPRGNDRATRLRDDWEPCEAGLAFAVARGFDGQDLRDEILKFRNYWTGKGGKDAAKLNWPRTWQNWILNARRPNNGKLTVQDAARNQHAERLRALDRPAPSAVCDGTGAGSIRRIPSR